MALTCYRDDAGKRAMRWPPPTPPTQISSPTWMPTVPRITRSFEGYRTISSTAKLSGSTRATRDVTPSQAPCPRQANIESGPFPAWPAASSEPSGAKWTLSMWKPTSTASVATGVCPRESRMSYCVPQPPM